MDTQVVVFPGLGHLFFWEKPGQFAKAVTSFLLEPAENHLSTVMEGSRAARATFTAATPI
jgi:hypothetical protein